MSRSIKVSHKSSEILTVILPVFKASMNLANIKCLSMLLGALCTVQTVCLSKLAGAFGHKASRESSFRRICRIQRFMAQVVLDFDVVAEYLRLTSLSTAHTRSLWTAPTGSWENSISTHWCQA